MFNVSEKSTGSSTAIPVQRANLKTVQQLTLFCLEAEINKGIILANIKGIDDILCLS